MKNSHSHCQSKIKIADGTMIIFSISAILFFKVLYIEKLESKLKISGVSNWMQNIISNLMIYYILCFIYSYQVLPASDNQAQDI